jgi:hypothetical protein
VYFDDFFLKTPQLESRLDILELYVYCIVLKYDPYSQMIPWFQNNKEIAAKKKNKLCKNRGGWGSTEYSCFVTRRIIEKSKKLKIWILDILSVISN